MTQSLGEPTWAPPTAAAIDQGLDHGLGTAAYFTSGTPSPGYAAIFEFVKRVAAR